MIRVHEDAVFVCVLACLSARMAPWHTTLPLSGTWLRNALLVSLHQRCCVCVRACVCVMSERLCASAKLSARVCLCASVCSFIPLLFQNVRC